MLFSELDKHKLYVLVRKDLTRAQKAVQACHAVAQVLLWFKDHDCWLNGTIVVLEVTDLKELEWEWKRINADNHIYNKDCFFEPDLNNEMTAFACILHESQYERFNHLRLLR